MTTTIETSRPSATQSPGALSDNPGGSVASPSADAPPVLPDPALAVGLGDGSMTELAILLAQADEQDRSEGRQLEDAADAAQARQDQDRVGKMRDKAGDDEASSILSGIGAMAAGGLAIAGLAIPLKTETASEMGKVVAGGADLMAGVFKGDAGRADAAAAEDEANAQADTRRATRAHDDAQAANASIDKIEQFLEQVSQSENAARLAAVSGRA